MKQAKKLILSNSIIWAGIMLATATLFRGNEQMSTLFIILVGGWFCVHASLLKVIKEFSLNELEESDKNRTNCCW